MTVKWKWNVKAFQKIIRVESEVRVKRAAIYLKAAVKINISVSSAGSNRASLVGEYPRRDSDELFSSIDYELDKKNLSAKISWGRNVKHGWYLEFGHARTIRKVAAPGKAFRFVAKDGTVVFMKVLVINPSPGRPFLRRSLHEGRKTIEGILTEGKK